MKRLLLTALAAFTFSNSSFAKEPELFVNASFSFGGSSASTPIVSSLGVRQWNGALNDYIPLSTFTANSHTGLAINLLNVPLAVKPVVLNAAEESVGSWISNVSTTALVVGGVVAVVAIASVSGSSDSPSNVPRGRNGESTTTCGIGGTATDPDIDGNCPAN